MNFMGFQIKQQKTQQVNHNLAGRARLLLPCSPGRSLLLGCALVWAWSGALAADGDNVNGSAIEETPVPSITAPVIPRLRPDFSGSWEKDFARSDRWEDELDRQLAQMRRNAQRGYSPDNGPTVTISSGSRIRRRSGANIVQLAQLAGYINRQTTLRIEQSATQVRVQRDEDADLLCDVQLNYSETYSDTTGEEVCGWEAQQLVFRTTLPEGVQIMHRFSLSSDRQELNMATTISSAAATFTQRQYFYAYDAPEDNFNCIQTISRGNACSLLDGTLNYDTLRNQ